MKHVRDVALAFDAITIEGGLLPADWLARIARLQAPHQAPADYGIPKGLNLRDELGRYWRIASAQWRDFVTARDAQPRAAARNFLTRLLTDVFGAHDVSRAAPALINEIAYPVTALAAGGKLPVVIAPANLTLDQRDPAFGDGHRQRSAFGLLQDYLNAEDDALWGLVGNGPVLRLARDNASLTRPAWIEADLARIFAEDRFADFSLLWLTIHASRFGNDGDLPQHCTLEAWREASREEGIRARDVLRVGVEQALLALGQGFLSEPGNDALRQQLAAGSLSPQGYFRELLRLVYRLIFLLTIEERGILHPGDSAAAAIATYREGYSLKRLRERARKRRAWDRHHDLWQGLAPVWKGLAHGEPLLALPALGGLFEPGQCAHLEGASLGNSALLAAMFHLGWLRAEGSLSRVNWRDMGPEELGSIYESLLELVPIIEDNGRRFAFAGADASAGNKRKTTGSYYTPDALVQQLLDSALDPLITERLAGANATDAEAALLGITVCDPACGSGHFLLGAARRLATRLARLRADGTPSGIDFRHALRDVVTRCIYGVDINPMAIELVRMSLWLEAMTPDRPLGFIDHHLRVGNALLGLADLDALEQGIPKDAFKPLSGDDKDTCKALASRNATELKDLARKREARTFGQQDWLATHTTALDALRALEAMPDATLDDIAAKQAAWQAFAEGAGDSPLRHAADLYLGAFLLTKTADTEAAIPTTASVVLELLGDTDAAGQDARRVASREACAEARVLHWPLAFPLIHAMGGFSCLLANPPWERVKLQEKEFFASRNTAITEARNKAERAQRIQWLSEGMLAAHLNPESHEGGPDVTEKRLYAEFVTARRTAETASTFAHVKGDDGGRYPLTGIGDVNTYALFAETFSQLLAGHARAGFIVPTGIATDDSTKAYFADITQRGRLVSLHDLENREGIFPAVHRSYKFCLLTLGEAERAEFVCFATQVAQLADPRRRFTLTPEDFRLINPNTLTCPVFRSERDAELTKKLYRAAPVLIDETQADGNPWGIQFMRMLDMSNDSHLFTDMPGEGRLPLYEAKLIHQFDHRFATYDPDGKTRDVTDAEKEDPDFTVAPRYWVDAAEVRQRLADKGWKHPWLMGWRDICRSTDERTVIASVLPRVGVGHTLPLFFTDQEPSYVAALLGNLDVLALDYIARVKIGGTHLTYSYLRQFPVLPPHRYSGTDLDFIVPRVLELTYTANDLAGWARDLGFDGSPFTWNSERRAALRAELDAWYARLYDLTRDELRYILDPADVMGEDYPSETFRVLKNNELKQYGEYRTRRLVLDAWDRLQSGGLY